MTSKKAKQKIKKENSRFSQRFSGLMNRANDIVFICMIIFVPLVLSNRTTDPALFPRMISLQILLLIGLPIAWLKSKQWRIEALNNGMVFIYIIFLLFELISIFWATNPIEGFYDWIRYFSVFLFFVFILVSLKSMTQEFILKALVVAGVILAVIGLIQSSGWDFGLPGSTKNNPYATMVNKNAFAEVMLVLFPFSAVSAFILKGWWRYISLFALFAILTVIVITSTRATWVGFAIALAIAVIVFLVVKRKLFIAFKPQTIIAFAIGLILVGFIFLYGVNTYHFKVNYQSIWSRIKSIRNNDYRIQIWQDTLEMVKDSPIIGSGLGNWKIEFSKYDSFLKNMPEESQDVSVSLLKNETSEMPKSGITIDALAPNNGYPGKTIAVVIKTSGTHFKKDLPPKVDFGSGIKVISTRVHSDNVLITIINIPLDVAAGGRTLTVSQEPFGIITSEDGFSVALFEWTRPHNDFLWILAEIGTIGFLIYITLIIVQFKYLAQSLFSKDTSTRKFIFLLGVLFATIAYLVDSMFSFPRERIYVSMLFAMCFAFGANMTEHKSNKLITNMARLLTNRVVPIAIYILLLAIFALTIQLTYADKYGKATIYYHEKKDWKPVVKMSTKAIEHWMFVDARNIPLHWYRGIAHFELGEISLARNDFEVSYRYNPNNIHVLNNLATTYEVGGNHEEAIKFYQRALDIYPGFIDAKVNLGASYYNKGDFIEAERIFSECLKQQRTDKIIQYLTESRKMIIGQKGIIR